MKKILVALLVVGAVGATSCKKDAESVPVKTLKVNGMPNNNLKDTGAWE
jgi:hypothetical protein|nr:hypothetical protein [uncultured Pedobacter sp.]